MLNQTTLEYLPNILGFLKEIGVKNNEFSAQKLKFNNKVCNFMLFCQEILRTILRVALEGFPVSGA